MGQLRLAVEKEKEKEKEKELINLPLEWLELTRASSSLFCFQKWQDPKYSLSLFRWREILPEAIQFAPNSFKT
jgi:hypothetical protein